jgi:hypothetical protein
MSGPLKKRHHHRLHIALLAPMMEGRRGQFPEPNFTDGFC